MTKEKLSPEATILKKHLETLPQDEPLLLPELAINSAILDAITEYADLRCKPLVDCLIDLKWRYSESEWIVAQIEKALQDYNKK